VPSLGGGLCLLTNALFRAAAELGWTILERHGHTIEVVPSAEVPWGVDATAAWPYVDLRFAVPQGAAPARLAVRVDADAVLLEVWSNAPRASVELCAKDDRIEIVAGQRIRSNQIVRRLAVNGAERLETIAANRKRLIPPADLARSCLTCDLTGCSGRVIVS
jgi:vancomycin resistance protein VanW